MTTTREISIKLSKARDAKVFTFKVPWTPDKWGATLERSLAEGTATIQAQNTARSLMRGTDKTKAKTQVEVQARFDKGFTPVNGTRTHLSDEQKAVRDANKALESAKKAGMTRDQLIATLGQ